MRRLRSGIRRVLASLGLVRHEEMEDRFSDEMRFHLEMHAERGIRAGMTPEEANRAAIVAFGGREQQREAARDAWGTRAVDELRQDIRFAARSLRRTPLLTTAAVTILGIGIGATTIMGSVVDQILLRPLPYPQSDRLVVIRESIREIVDKYPVLSANASHFIEWERNCTRCEAIGAAQLRTATLTTNEAQEIAVLRATPPLLPMLGAAPRHGRLFSMQEDQSGARVAVAGHRFWQRHLGGDASAIGKTITVDGASTRIIGVLPEEFVFPKGRELGTLSPLPDEPDLIVPMSFTPRERVTLGEFSYIVIARMARGATQPQLVSELERLQRGVAERAGATMTLSAVVTPMHEQVVGESRAPLAMLFAAVVAVLLIVWTNLANLLVARNVDREREAAVRVAMGAGRQRLVRQALTESILLATIGGFAGLAVSFVGLSSLIRLAPADVPRLAEVGVNGRVLLMGLAASLITGIAFGVFPALRFAASDPHLMLRGGGRTATDTRRHRRQRNVLVGAQVAMSVVLLVSGGLLLTSFVRVLRVDRGFSATQVVAMDLTLPPAAYLTDEARIATYDAMLERVRGVRGVRTAAIATGIPLEGERQVDMLSLENDPRRAVERPVANILRISPTYMQALGLRLVGGRMFSDADRGRRVVVLSESAARSLWREGDPVGRRVVPGSNDSIAEVVGVVADVRTSTLEQEGAAIAYLPHWKNVPATVTVLVRTKGDPAAAVAGVRDMIRQVAPSAPVSRVRTIDEIIDAATAQRRFQLMLVTFFAVVALVTAAVGLYAMLSYSLARRGREIAIRMAVGATEADVRRLALREGLAPVIAGLVVGVAGSIVAARAVASLLFQASPGDPVVVGSVSILILLVGAAACYIPGRRAASAGTADALRMA